MMYFLMLVVIIIQAILIVQSRSTVKQIKSLLEADVKQDCAEHSASLDVRFSQNQFYLASLIASVPSLTKFSYEKSDWLERCEYMRRYLDTKSSEKELSEEEANYLDFLNWYLQLHNGEQHL